jgi:hypothetical protein
MENRQSIRKILEDKFSLDELQIICFDLSLEYENLKGDTKQMKVIEIISYCERYDRVSELLEMVQKARPGLSLPIASKTELQEAAAPIYLTVEVDGKIEGPLTIVRERVLAKGVIEGEITILDNGQLDLVGVCTDNVIIRDDSIVYVRGVVEKNIINISGILEIYGVVNGYVSTRQRGITFVDKNAHIGVLLS